MKQLVHKILSRLREPDAPLSRNRHFTTFDTPEGAAALERHKGLRSVERDLAQADPSGVAVIADPDSNSVRIEIQLPQLRLRRVAVVGRDELDLLLASPGTGPVLQAALDRDASDEQDG